MHLNEEMNESNIQRCTHTEGRQNQCSQCTLGNLEGVSGLLHILFSDCYEQGLRLSVLSGHSYHHHHTICHTFLGMYDIAVLSTRLVFLGNDFPN